MTGGEGLFHEMWPGRDEFGDDQDAFRTGQDAFRTEQDAFQHDKDKFRTDGAWGDALVSTDSDGYPLQGMHACIFYICMLPEPR